VIVGHSERRHVLGEDDEVVRRKVRAALDASLRPVLCVGEKIEEREAGETESVVKRQTESALEGIADTEFASVTLAYEPVWAIGTGRTATPEQARDVHAFLRSVLADLFGGEAADRCRILYGGSVKPGNIEDLMAQEGIQGALVGGASLTSDSFAAIVRGAMKDRG
jgi:triosephosphate isomerase